MENEQLLTIIERVERLNEEKAALCEDIKQVYSEAKGNGFDVKILKIIVRLRRMEDADREEEETLLDMYKNAIGLK